MRKWVQDVSAALCIGSWHAGYHTYTSDSCLSVDVHISLSVDRKLEQK